MTFNKMDETLLGKILKLKRGYDLPKKSRIDGPIPVISSAGITGYHHRHKVEGPGVVTGRYGTIGNVFFQESHYWPLNTTLYVSDFCGNDPLYLYYLLKTIDFASCSDKAAVPGVNRNHLHNLKSRYHVNLDAQKCIASILRLLDNKIELNKQINAILKEILQAIFVSWFVLFEPVQAKIAAKAKGCDPQRAAMAAICDREDLDQLESSRFNELAALSELFPDELENHGGIFIPKGWDYLRLGDEVDILRGLSYKGAGIGDLGVPMHNLNSIYEGGGYKRSGLKYYSLKYCDKYRVFPNDVLVANTEQGFEFRLIGYAALVPSFYEESFFSHHLYRLRPKLNSRITAEYLYHLFLPGDFQRTIAHYGNGTTVNMLPSDALEKPRFILPGSCLLEVFTTMAKNIYQTCEMNSLECDDLTEIRDMLLPKFMSGELDIGQVLPQMKEKERGQI